MDIKRLDTILTNSTVEELQQMAAIARASRKALVKADGDYAGTWSDWSVVPNIAPQWLWKMARGADSWTLCFVAESLSLISSDVRASSNGKPFTNLMYYANAGYRDNEVLIKWSNSSKDRISKVKGGITDNLITAARAGYESERLDIFLQVFDNVYKAFQNGELPDDEIVYVEEDSNYNNDKVEMEGY